MIVVNVNKSSVGAVSDADFREAAAGDWRISDSTVRGHGDYLAAARDNIICGVWRIVDHLRTDEGRVRFTLAPEPHAAIQLVGEAVPVPWVRGSANPVKTWDWQPSPDASLSESSVTLNGWTLWLREDGAAQLTSPEGSGVLTLEALIGEPGHGQAVFRTG